MIVLGNYIQTIIDSLFEDGMNIIRRARDTKEANNRTYNMEDAYGCAVYYNGKIVKKGYANETPKSKRIHKGWDKVGISENTGRGYVDKFLDEYDVPRKGLFLICVNAVYYTVILEDGGGYALKEYRIISQVDNDFDRLASKYKGSKIINLKGIY